MIEVNPDDRRFLCFLWWESPFSKETNILQHCRVVFGVNCSPYILGAVLEYHLGAVDEKYKSVAEKLLKSLYVDNSVNSVDTYSEYEQFKLVSTNLLGEAKMELRQWECTSGRSEDSDSEQSQEESTPVLGYSWNKFEDTIRISYAGNKDIGDHITKRIILSEVQKVFDPIGILCPALLPPKLILQQAWAEKEEVKSKDGSWDLELNQNLQSRFKESWSEASVLCKIAIPRWIQRNFSSEQLHVFGDASKDAYAAVIFLRVETEDCVSVQLVQAKSRISPLKRMTIPRLELMACTIAARLTVAVQEALEMENVPTYFWSDSTTAIAWIHRNDEWGTFVGNRVKEICSLTQPETWRHIPGKFNPADLPSRGCTPTELLHSSWWEGPEWLKKTPDCWPVEEINPDEEEVMREKKKKSVVVLSVLPAERPWYCVTFSSYSSNVRVMAWILRFVAKTSKTKSKVKGELLPEEILAAEKRLFLLVQKEVFADKKVGVISGVHTVLKDGLLCVKTRLLNRCDTPAFKNPVVLPNSHPFIEQLITEEHITKKHAGAQYLLGRLREKCWILQARKAVKAVTSKCVICRRYGLKTPVVAAAPLPENRVKDAKAFQVTGVDLAGPLFLKDGTKTWIVLFTCATVRAVHLELVAALSTEAFLMALRCFIGRRGRPDTIYSDNGTNFVGADNLFRALDWEKIQQSTRTSRISWRFNPPASPWWGGWWERLIRSVKDLLRKTLGQSRVTEPELRTCLCEIEAIMNGRALTHHTDDPSDLEVLTPSLFIQDIQITDFPEISTLDGNRLRAKFRSLSRIKEELHSRFRTEYLAELVHRGKDRKPEDFKVGDMVWVAADNKKRLDWPLARIIELLPGSDGKTRVAKIKTATGEFLRPLQRLHPMEVSHPLTLPDAPCQPTTSKLKESLEEVVLEVRTRSGRITKKPERFGC